MYSSGKYFAKKVHYTQSRERHRFVKKKVELAMIQLHVKFPGV